MISFSETVTLLMSKLSWRCEEGSAAAALAAASWHGVTLAECGGSLGQPNEEPGGDRLCTFWLRPAEVRTLFVRYNDLNQGALEWSASCLTKLEQK